MALGYIPVILALLFLLVGGFVIGTVVASKECNAAYRPYMVELTQFRHDCQWDYCLPPVMTEYNYTIRILE